MTIDEYAEWAVEIAKVSASADGLAYLGLGLAGESGEVADLIKKLLLLGLPVRSCRQESVRGTRGEQIENRP